MSIHQTSNEPYSSHKASTPDLIATNVEPLEANVVEISGKDQSELAVSRNECTGVVIYCRGVCDFAIPHQAYLLLTAFLINGRSKDDFKDSGSR
jgi:hypothetical protein